jgi:hypothetical protein
MSAEERCAELRWFLHADGGELIAKGYGKFEHIHKRIEELVGRSVWTHELLFEDELCEEIRTGVRPSMDDIVMRMQMAAGPDKPVLTVDVDSGEVRRVQ